MRATFWSQRDLKEQFLDGFLVCMFRSRPTAIEDDVGSDAEVEDKYTFVHCSYFCGNPIEPLWILMDCKELEDDYRIPIGAELTLEAIL